METSLTIEHIPPSKHSQSFVIAWIANAFRFTNRDNDSIPIYD